MPQPRTLVIEEPGRRGGGGGGGFGSAATPGSSRRRQAGEPYGGGPSTPAAMTRAIISIVDAVGSPSRSPRRVRKGERRVGEGA